LSQKSFIAHLLNTNSTAVFYFLRQGIGLVCPFKIAVQSLHYIALRCISLVSRERS